MGNIVLLDELTINKIAAGEVIERPASVIKEMVENSIDAKASNVTIEIQNGGISYIKITDNGKGIAKDDLEMAFERHATSKIRCAEDLNTVTSMGFRGEALASIAAIANVEMVSKTQDQDVGYKVVIEGGRILEKQEIGCQTGTTITVQNLFYNTPVRYKFLKKDYTETGYIEDVVTRIALVNPNIAFKLINSGKTILQTSGNGDLKSVIYSIYGKDVAQGIIEVNYTYEDMKIVGIIGKPEIARSNRSNQLYFVNKRYVKDKILTAATEQAYKGTIDAGKFAFVVLNLEMPQNKVDVNVHPAKLEVRFQEESKIFQAIFHAIKDSMAKDIAKNDTSTKVDNIIIQSSSRLTSKTENKVSSLSLEEKQKTNGIFAWRKNRNDKNFGNNNIIEDLYNEKKVNETPSFNTESDIPKAFLNVKNEANNLDDVVNTSDVLKELKQINENVKNEIKAEQIKKEDSILSKNSKNIENNIEKQFNVENKKLPDGTTYTYVGENKEKIEDLLRQLHPETYKPKEEKTAYENEYKLNVIEQVKPEPNVIEQAKPELNVAEKENSYQLDSREENQKENQKENNEETEPFIPMIFRREKNNNEGELHKEEQQIAQNSYEEEQNNNEEEQPLSNDFSKMYEKLFGTAIVNPKTQEEQEQEEINAVDIIKDNVSVFDEISEYKRPTYKLIGIVFHSYIIAEIEKDMYIINVCSAREKIMYEKLRTNYYTQINKDSQMLLLPDILELSNKEIEVIKENSVMLARAGFALEEFGENTIKLTGVPTVCLNLDTKSLLIEIIEAINTVARTSIKEKEEKFLSTVAAKISQKMNSGMSIREIDNLMEELFSLPNPFTYDFDKPIAIKMTKYDIERKFSRK